MVGQPILVNLLGALVCLWSRAHSVGVRRVTCLLVRVRSAGIQAVAPNARDYAATSDVVLRLAAGGVSFLSPRTGAAVPNSEPSAMTCAKPSWSPVV